MKKMSLKLKLHSRVSSLLLEKLIFPSLRKSKNVLSKEKSTLFAANGRNWSQSTFRRIMLRLQTFISEMISFLLLINIVFIF